MKAIVKKIYKGEVAATIYKKFVDSYELREFLVSQGVHISFKEASEDLAQDEVTYSVPLLNVGASNEYQ